MTVRTGVWRGSEQNLALRGYPLRSTWGRSVVEAMAGDPHPVVAWINRATITSCWSGSDTIGGRWWAVRRGLRKCAGCSRETSVTAGTIFHGSRPPLRSWFSAMWYVVNQKNGVSALGLQRVLGFGSYQTAWAWLHRLRRAMVLPGRELLTGAVEVDEP